MKNIYSSIIFVLLANFVFAQATLTGVVRSATSKETLIGVSVLVDDAGAVVITDAEGKFSAPLAVGKHKVVFRMIGMAEKTISLNLAEGENSIQIIFLEESAKELGLVVVSAGKFEQKIEDVTVSMSVIKPSLVENKNTTTMDDIIDQSPSVNIIDGQANIRGGSGWSYGAGSRVMVLVDDLPMLTADAGDAKWSFLPVENLEQIEIIKGASSALFGSSAMNGVINIRTAFPKDEPQTRFNYYTGIYDSNPKLTLNDTTYNLDWGGKIPQMIGGMNFFHSRKIKQLDFVLGGNVFHDEGYRRGEYEYRMRINGNMRYRFKSIDGLSAGVNFNTMKTDGSLFFIWLKDTAGYLPQPGTLSKYTTYRTNIDPFITYIDKKGNVIKLRTRFFRANNLNSTNQESKADLYYGDLQFQKHLSDKFTVSVGLVESSSLVKSELYSNHDGSNFALYAQGDAKINRFTFSLGGRMEKYRVDSLSDKFTPVVRAGVNYHLIGATYLRSSFGQGYRYPGIAEKYIKTQIGAMNIYPNDSLQSEKGYSTEFGVMQGLKVGGWKGYFDVAAFYTEYRNMIEFTFSQWEQPSFDPITGKFNYGVGFKALNIGTTKIQGLDISLSGTGDVAGLQVTILGGYTFMDPKVVTYDSSYIKAQHSLDPDSNYSAYLGSDSSNFLKYRFNHLAKADVEVGYKKFSVGIGMRYNSFMKNIDKLFVHSAFGPLITPGVAHYRNNHKHGDVVYDARASYQVTEEAKVAFIVKNMLNNIFMQRPADMQPPRVWMVQFTWNI